VDSLKFILVVVIFAAANLGFVFFGKLIFKPKSTSTEEFLSEYFDWLKAIPGGMLFILGWGIFWMIPIISVMSLLDLMLVNSVFKGIGFLTRILLIFVGLAILMFWYFFGWTKLPRHKNLNGDDDL